MKRIYNDIPVQSVLFCVGGDVDIVIEDYARRDQFYGGLTYAEPVQVWSGKVKDVSWVRRENPIPYKFLSAKVCHIETTGTGVLIFRICTAWDQFSF